MTQWENPLYGGLIQADIAQWSPPAPPALIFSNAALNWLQDHAALMPRLARMLAAGGVLLAACNSKEAAPTQVGAQPTAGPGPSPTARSYADELGDPGGLDSVSHTLAGDLGGPDAR